MNAIVPVVPRPIALAVLCVAVIPGVAGPAWAQGLAQPAASPVSVRPASPEPVPLTVPPQRPSAGTNDGQTNLPGLVSDGPEFCASLGERVGDMSRDTKVPAEVADLAREGKRLCADGKTRSGILHLRRAYVLMRQTSEPRSPKP